MKLKIEFSILLTLILMWFSSCGGSISETHIYNNSSTEELIVELFSSKPENLVIENDTFCIVNGPTIKFRKFYMNNIRANLSKNYDTLKLVNEGIGNGCMRISDLSDLDYFLKKNIVEILRLDLKNKDVHLRVRVIPNNKLTIGYIGNTFAEMRPSVDWDSVKIIKENEPITICEKNIKSIITREGGTGSCGLNENLFIIDENKGGS